MFKWQKGLLLLLMMVTMPAALLADMIGLDNGDVLTGRVSSMEGKRLNFETDYARTLSVSKERIRRIVTDSEVRVHLATGEILVGRLQTTDDGRIWVDRPVPDAPVFLSWVQVAAINPPAVKWSGSLVLGGTRESGNTDRQSASVSFDGKRRSGKERLSFHLLSNYAEEDNKVTTRNTYGRLKYDYFFTRRFYGFLGIEALYDKFKDLNLRTVAGPGAGYQVWDEERKSLSFELGIAYHNEDHIVGEDDYWFTGRAAADFAFRFDGGVEFGEQVIYYPRLGDVGDYQLRNEASVATTLLSDWALKLSNILDYDSRPEAGVDKRDEVWILGLQYSF